MKILPFLIVLIILGGIWWLWQSDDDRGPQQVFAEIERRIAPLARSLNAQYLQRRQLNVQSLTARTINLSKPQPLSVTYRIEVTETNITVTLQSADERLNNRRILFEPKIVEESNPPQVAWSCSGGDLLMRYRSKACRTGVGLVLQ